MNAEPSKISKEHISYFFHLYQIRKNGIGQQKALDMLLAVITGYITDKTIDDLKEACYEFDR